MYGLEKPPALRYLIHAANVPFSGNLINPAGLTGGCIYLNGYHVLPLHLVAQKYGVDRGGFLARGRFPSSPAVSPDCRCRHFAAAR